jgi:hypothetical protein
MPPILAKNNGPFQAILPRTTQQKDVKQFTPFVKKFCRCLDLSGGVNSASCHMKIALFQTPAPSTG